MPEYIQCKNCIYKASHHYFKAFFYPHAIFFIGNLSTIDQKHKKLSLKSFLKPQASYKSVYRTPRPPNQFYFSYFQKQWLCKC